MLSAEEAVHLRRWVVIYRRSIPARDGELRRTPPRLGATHRGCAACRQAREAFLLLRQELRAYDWRPDPHAQSWRWQQYWDPTRQRWRPLRRCRRAGRRAFLGSARAGQIVVGTPHRTRLRFAAFAPRMSQRWRCFSSETVLGVRWFTSSNTSPRPQHSGASALANANSLPVQAERVGSVRTWRR